MPRKKLCSPFCFMFTFTMSGRACCRVAEAPQSRVWCSALQHPDLSCRQGQQHQLPLQELWGPCPPSVATTHAQVTPLQGHLEPMSPSLCAMGLGALGLSEWRGAAGSVQGPAAGSGESSCPTHAKTPPQQHPTGRLRAAGANVRVQAPAHGRAPQNTRLT